VRVLAESRIGVVVELINQRDRNVFRMVDLVLGFGTTHTLYLGIIRRSRMSQQASIELSALDEHAGGARAGNTTEPRDVTSNGDH
jgi:hypothetical protein